MKLAMKNILWVSCLFLIAVASSLSGGSQASVYSGGPQSAATVAKEPAATHFYRSVARNILSAKGELRFTFHEGSAITRVGNTIDIHWFVRPQTHASVRFEYDEVSRNWRTLKMFFAPEPLIVSFREGRADAMRHQITRIDFRRSGEPLEYYDEHGLPIGLALSRFPEIRQHLRIPQGPTSLFLGQPFAGLEESPASGGRGLQVREVNIPRDLQERRFVTFTLRPQSRISLAEGLGGDARMSNWIQLRDEAAVVIPALTYQTDGQRTEGNLDPLTVTLTDGHLGVDRTSLKLDSGVTFSFRRLLFTTTERAGVAAGVFVEGGLLLGKVKPGSVVEVAHTEDESSVLQVSSAGPVRLSGLQLTYQNPFIVTVVVDSADLPLSGSVGKLYLDEDTVLELEFQQSPQIALSLNRSVWTSNKSPRLKGRIPEFAATVADGQIILNEQTILEIDTGKIVATGLQIDTAQENPFSSTMTEARFDLAANSSFGVTNHLTTTVSRGRVIAATSAQPLIVAFPKNSTRGHFSLEEMVVSSGSQQFGAQGALALTSGLLSASVNKSPGSDLRGRVSGSLNAGPSALRMDSHNDYQIKRGNLRFEDLLLTNQSLTGPLESIVLQFSDSTISIPNSVIARITEQATLESGTGPLNLRISEDGSLVGTYHLHLPIHGGEIKLGKVGQVELIGGTLDFFYTKNLGEKEQIKANVDLQLGPGHIRPARNIAVTLKGKSRLKAQALSVSDTEGVFGVLAELELALGAGVIAIPGGFVIEAKDGGRLTTNQAAQPPMVGASSSFLQGSFLLDLPFSNFYNAQDVSLQFTEGRIRLPLQNSSDGTISGAGCTIAGTLGVDFSAPNQPSLTIPIAISITEGTLLQRPTETTAHFEAAFNATIPRGLRIPIKTKEEDPPGDAFVRSIDLVIATASETNLVGRITLDGPALSVPAITQTASLNVEIPATQEIFTDKFSCPFSCTLHIFLVSHVYPSTARLAIRMSQAEIDVSVDQVNLAEDIKWDRDGCGVCIALAEIGSFFTFGLIPSPSKLAEDKLRDKQSGFRFSVKRKLKAPAATL